MEHEKETRPCEWYKLNMRNGLVDVKVQSYKTFLLNLIKNTSLKKKENKPHHF